jgi:spermidine/putrescine transport system permease protein
LIAPSIFGAMVIAFAISFDEVLITNFTSGTTQTLPLFVLSRLRRTIDPSVNAVATILLLVPWVVVGFSLLWQRTRTGRSAVGAPAEDLARAA